MSLAQANKMSSKSNSLSVSSFDYNFLNGIQPYSHKPTFSKAPVVNDGEHELEEKTDVKEKVDERIAKSNRQKCCPMLTKFLKKHL